MNDAPILHPAGAGIKHGQKKAAAASCSGCKIAVESPAYLGMFELIESLGMLALEIETCPVAGVSLDALERAIHMHPVRACMFSSSVNSPLGCVSSDTHREQLVRLLEAHDIPLIEDDVYGELVYEGPRRLATGSAGCCRASTWSLRAN